MVLSEICDTDVDIASVLVNKRSNRIWVKTNSQIITKFVCGSGKHKGKLVDDPCECSQGLAVELGTVRQISAMANPNQKMPKVRLSKSAAKSFLDKIPTKITIK